ncbi:hypothetical protein [Ichthyobacterium seriolicida]|uniref:Lipoprotein n=1 Tax=Ichthyobacterium seriolicida TaxID=242600 RepID=A0A1J1DXR0_9FLAO|nr:hypothetical protein [Ichthyobacterium seriolicida]BAV94625.1 hypothetical protein JBKA6_0612 [Ichthyobacterium seriolicida]
MKTNKIFKNILSLLTFGLVVFSCNKSTEETETGNEIANIKSIVFTKAKNRTTATKAASTPSASPATPAAPNANVSDAYKALFITKTPAVELDDEFEADIEGDSIIKVIVPFNTKLTSTTPVTLKATITLKEKLGENVYLDGNKLDANANALSFDHVITTKLVHSELKTGVSKIFEISKKEGDKVIAKKSFKVMFIHDTPSTNSVLATGTATGGKTPVTGLGFTTGTSGQPNEKIKAGATAASPMYPTKASSNAGAGTQASPFELTMTGTSSAAQELVQSVSFDANTKFKVDVLTLPNGAFIDVTAANFTAISNHLVTDPTTAAGFAISTTDHGIQFRVVAQDGTSATYYKLTFKNSAS